MKRICIQTGCNDNSVQLLLHPFITGKGHRSDAAEMMNMATNQVALDQLKFQWVFDLIQVVSNVFNELVQI